MSQSLKEYLLLLEHYDALVLTKGSVRKLRSKFKPKFPDFIGHHVTLRFNVDKEDKLPKNIHSARVVGYSEGDDIEALIVEINGKLHRPDGNLYHITWSLDRSKGKKPVHSNNLIREHGWRHIDDIIPIDFTIERMR